MSLDVITVRGVSVVPWRQGSHLPDNPLAAPIAGSVDVALVRDWHERQAAPIGDAGQPPSPLMADDRRRCARALEQLLEGTGDQVRETLREVVRFHRGAVAGQLLPGWSAFHAEAAQAVTAACLRAVEGRRAA